MQGRLGPRLLGNSLLATGAHSYLLRGEEIPSCPHCDVPLTVAHVLLACPRHRASRNRLLGRLDDSVWVRSGTLFSFIREIQIQVVYSPGYVC